MLNPVFHYVCIILFYSVSRVAEGRPASVPKSPPKPLQGLVPALYVFGDSLVDNGNNNNLLSFVKANFPPYGVDFPEGPTGRFTNGKNIADCISEELGLPFSPPCMQKKEPIPDWATGFNYASASCGILPESGKGILGTTCYNFDEQIDKFNYTIEGVLKKHYPTKQDLAHHLSKSLFVFVIGNNDYLNNYLNSRYNKYNNFTPEEFGEVLHTILSEQLKRVHKLGARKMIFVEIAPVGCMPFIVKTTIPKPKGGCDDIKNDIVKKFNDGLEKTISSLQHKFKDSQFVVAKIFQLVIDIVKDRHHFGFENSKDSCCKAIAGLLQCRWRSSPCIPRDKYVFFDPFHPTEALASLAVKQCLTNSSICGNLRQLLEA